MDVPIDNRWEPIMEWIRFRISLAALLVKVNAMIELLGIPWSIHVGNTMRYHFGFAATPGPANVMSGPSIVVTAFR